MKRLVRSQVAAHVGPNEFDGCHFGGDLLAVVTPVGGRLSLIPNFRIYPIQAVEDPGGILRGAPLRLASKCVVF